ncbi:hypothetical protein AMAG_08355 [Allomyces macrogynus ATCC 38327]|uniref:Serine aminopeptidase S33 domain-containing protein n=1 Tax=Allomyces macrogynus (strain ATCC 38327) TaxID=578462 RepID=A0A0L0SKW2_ALLM3|nr:hypothetical protein AMAG_08355 [Allomyces macrogynus ATCC 38327]|eukprot:KNE63206.1 hypothetical protein AMAG_08355 [Allomyces macrogynus ATCC 38327]
MPAQITKQIKEQLLNPPVGGWIKLKDGHEVYARTWAVPEGTELVATLTWVHGLGEHINRYEHVFPAIAAAGIRVHAWDQRGFGRTALKHGSHGQTLGWTQVLDDVSEALHRNKMPGKPQFLGGQSMGGLIVLDFLRQRGKDHDLAGVISTSPAIETWPASRPPTVAVYALRILCRVTPSMTISNAVDAAGLCHDDAVVRAYQDDPLVHPQMSLIAGVGVLDTGALLAGPTAARELPANVPLLLMHGDKDPITYQPGTTAFYERASHLKDRTLKVYEGYKHELHCEPDIRDDVMRAWVDWMAARLNGPVTTAA